MNSDREIKELKKRQLFKDCKNRLKEILLYLDSDDYSVDSTTKSDMIINDHIYIYNKLRKKYNRTYDIPDKKKRIKFLVLYFKVFKYLLNNENCLMRYNNIIKFKSLF